MPQHDESPVPHQPAPPPDADYVVIGSGAGGGTVAARLAEEGFRVLLLEAGGDPRAMTGSHPRHPDRNTLPDDYDVPAFHAFATENDAMAWDFFVSHYEDDVRRRRDPKYRDTWKDQPVNGVWYPRAGTLGGCTAHNALIFVYPHDSDWNEIADLTGDPSWRSERMRSYFERLEECRYRPNERRLSRLGRNPSRHGWEGWLPTERAIPDATFRDRDLREALVESASEALEHLGRPGRSQARLRSQGDPNDWRVVKEDEIGLRYTPLTTRNHQRFGTRERLLEVQQRHPDRLSIQTHALATRVLFDAANRAIGVEYLRGERLYRAHVRPGDGDGELRRAYASAEVILAGGAFNTPQLLMLSGIGPRAVLESHGIPVRVDLPGVGKNLQDRYEVAVVNRMNFDAWRSLRGATFTSDDAQYREWREKRDGVYATNGTLLSVVLRSGPDRPVPDLFCYAVIGEFSGYFPTYSSRLPDSLNCLTWVVLKAHTANTAGEVTLRSADPRDRPIINFRYFDEGNDSRGEDLDAVVSGVRFVRHLSGRLKEEGLLAREELPGDHVQSDEELKQFVRDHAWGHHASCSCRIGTLEQRGVVSSDFKVHGVRGLRVVDASVFPRTPGLFIASAVYMVGEKAADVIASERTRG
jgi:choline dehydrogenase-like flavoprotein